MMGVPVVASGRKAFAEHAESRLVFTPPTCCGLPRSDALGAYGRRFGIPELRIETAEGQVVKARVLRGAPCGSTWKAAQDLEGIEIEDAARHFGLCTQYYCTADPAGWDPLFGRSPVHFAAELAEQAVKKALE